MAQTNYGVILSRLWRYTTIGEVVSVDPPEMSVPQLNPPITARADIVPLFQANLLKLASSKRR
jgi:hypothetical protein